MRVRFPLPAPLISGSYHFVAELQTNQETMKKIATCILLATAMGALVVNAKEADCLAISQSVAIEVSANQAHVLEIVSGQVAAAPGCACEIVKSAIKASKADVPTVVAIVGAAITEAPEQLRLISQCAIAAAPDAITAIRALLATLDPNSGDSGSGAKDSKAAGDTEVAAQFNPLDFPSGFEGGGVGGVGGDGNAPRFSVTGDPRFFFDLNGGVPTFFNPPVITNPNPFQINRVN